MAKFPSVKWFSEVRDVFNSDDRYHGGGGGRLNCRSAMKIGDKVFLVAFEGLECVETRELKPAELDESLDFYLEMTPEMWRDMVGDIAENGAASLNFTLNTIDLELPDGLAQSVHGDQFREDLFFRYNQTYQYFFDASARVKTTF